MPDDILKDAIETSRRILGEVTDFESQGIFFYSFHTLSYFFQGLDCAEKIKTEFDIRWSPHWHCIIGRNFGSFVTHETKNFIFFYLGDKAIMLFKSG